MARRIVAIPIDESVDPADAIDDACGVVGMPRQGNEMILFQNEAIEGGAFVSDAEVNNFIEPIGKLLAHIIDIPKGERESVTPGSSPERYDRKGTDARELSAVFDECGATSRSCEGPGTREKVSDVVRRVKANEMEIEHRANEVSRPRKHLEDFERRKRNVKKSPMRPRCPRCRSARARRRR